MHGVMLVGAQTRQDMIAAIPKLRAMAVSLCGNADQADDFVQETLVKALANIGSFAIGSNLSAWLFTILRNVFYSECRKRRREVADIDGCFSSALACRPDQDEHMEFLDFRRAFQKIPAEQREALILIAASGLSYEEAAEICDCAVGTLKSRVSRARRRLSKLLEAVPSVSAPRARLGPWHSAQHRSR